MEKKNEDYENKIERYWRSNEKFPPEFQERWRKRQQWKRTCLRIFQNRRHTLSSSKFWVGGCGIKGKSTAKEQVVRITVVLNIFPSPYTWELEPILWNSWGSLCLGLLVWSVHLWRETTVLLGVADSRRGRCQALVTHLRQCLSSSSP